MSVTTRRERRERELRRRQRQKRGNEPSRGDGGGRGWIAGAAAVVVVIALIFGLRQAGVLTAAPPTPSASPLPTAVALASDDPARGTKEADTSRDHVNAGTPVTYATLPPTSGNHWAAPAGPVKAGVYDKTLPFEATTHNLEHGGIVIVYSGLNADDTKALKDFVTRTIATQYKKVLVEPYPELQGAKVTATAWDWRLNLQTFDAAALTKFIQAHYDGPDAPEPGAGW